MESKRVSLEKKAKKRFRIKRGSGITKEIPLEVLKKVEEGDDPFVDCNSERWTLKMALEHIKRHHPKTVVNTAAPIRSSVTHATFDYFSNTLVVILFRIYEKLETVLQNNLRIFYFSLEYSNPRRFRNLTNSLHRHNILSKYPWLTTDEKLKELNDIQSEYGRNRNDDESKPFSEACKQYEIEKRKSSIIQKSINAIVNEPKNLMHQSLYAYNINIPNTSHNTNYLNVIERNQLNPQIPFNVNLRNITDKHVLLSQENKNMISAINCNYQHTQNKSNETQCFKEVLNPSDSSKRKTKKRSRWSSPSKDITPTEINKITNKLTPMMHFEIRKIKLITEKDLSLGDLIVLVSYFYKLEYMEQQLLIGKMKILETTKPNQAAYLRQYVRTTCPLYNENEILFKPLPEELIVSESDMNLHHVTCIEDILENDFCVFQENKCIEECVDGDIKHDSKEFDFGSEFL